MIDFEDLYLICQVENNFYKVIIDGNFSTKGRCYNCAFNGLSLCDEYKCCSANHFLKYHYEEISKETIAAMRRLCNQR